jgi:hypothetical protein
MASLCMSCGNRHKREVKYSTLVAVACLSGSSSVASGCPAKAAASLRQAGPATSRVLCTTSRSTSGLRSAQSTRQPVIVAGSQRVPDCALHVADDPPLLKPADVAQLPQWRVQRTSVTLSRASGGAAGTHATYDCAHP